MPNRTPPAPQLLQLQVQEAPKSVSIKVKLPRALWDDLRMIQDGIEKDPLLPSVSIHALMLKAVRNYVKEFAGERGRKS